MDQFNKELFDEFRKLNLPIGEYIIVSSGVLAIRWIRKANDIDVAVSEKLWNELLKKYELTIENNVEKIIPMDKVEIFGEGSFKKFNKTKKTGPLIHEQILHAEIIENLSFQNINDCLWFKSHSEREKDARDVALINEYLWYSSQKTV